jgi:cytochrome c556
MASDQVSPAPPSPPPVAQSSPPAAVSQDDADAIILDRQLVMQQLDKDTKALGEIVAGLRPPDKMADHAKAIAKGAKDAFKAFEPKVGGGGSKPEVWSNWEDFSKRMQAFATASDAMAKASETGNVVAVSELMIPALPCKQCHDIYRFQKPGS